MRRRQCGQRVEHVVPAQQGPAHLPEFLAAVQDREGAAVVGDQPRAPVQWRAVAPRAMHAKALDRRPAPHGKHFRQQGVLAIDDQSPVARHGTHQMVELALDRSHVGEDVGVVVLEVVEDGHARAVVHELAALVEERGVVFVGLDHERVAGSGRQVRAIGLGMDSARATLPRRRQCAQPRRHPEILGHPADQETRLASACLQQVRQHGAGGGLAVGPGHRQGLAPGQHRLGQPLRAGHVRAARVQHRLHRRVAARERIADHHLVAVGRDVAGQVTLGQGDAQHFQLGGHGRIDRQVAAFDLVAPLARQRRHATHEGAADAEDMEFAHGAIVA